MQLKIAIKLTFIAKRFAVFTTICLLCGFFVSTALNAQNAAIDAISPKKQKRQSKQSFTTPSFRDFIKPNPIENLIKENTTVATEVNSEVAPIDTKSVSDGEQVKAIKPGDEKDAPLPPSAVAISPVDSNDIRIALKLPAVFSNLEILNEALTIFSDFSETLGKNKSCDLIETKALSATYSFSCNKSPISKYYVKLRGFSSIPFSIQRETDEQNFQIRPPIDAFISQVKVQIRSKSLRNMPDEDSRPLEMVSIVNNWQRYLSDDNRPLVKDFFTQIDDRAEEAAQFCRLKIPIKIADLLTDETNLERRLTCNFIALNFTSIPKSLLENLRVDACYQEVDLGGVCLFENAELAQNASIQGLPDGGFWTTTTVDLLSPDLKLSNHIVFDPAVPLFQSEKSFQFGQSQFLVHLEEVSLTGRNDNCGVALELSDKNGGIALLSDVALSSFGCDKKSIIPQTINFTVVGKENINDGIMGSIKRSLPINAPIENLEFGPLDFISKVKVDFVSEDKSILPEYFELRIHSSLENCEAAQATPLLSLPMNRDDLSISVSGDVISKTKRPLVVFLEGAVPVSRCQELDLTEIVAGNGSVEIQLLRATGPFSIVLLSPSKKLLDQGWRNVIQTVLRRFVNELREKDTPPAVDIYEVAESRKLVPLVLSQEVLNFPATGGRQSIQGRFDRVRYDTAKPKPLRDLNLLQQRIADLKVKKILVVTDSSNEEFLPQDTGSLYNWLINKKLEIQVISLSSCQAWITLSENTTNKIQCLDLQSIKNMSIDDQIKSIGSKLDGLVK